MPVLTPGQVAGIASQGTPAGTTTEEWVAKARQESTFDSDVDNGVCCIGLWQVNYKVHTQYPKAALRDPWNNWQATRAIYAAQGWGAWADSGGRPTATAADRRAVQEWDPKYARPSSGFDPMYVVEHPLDSLGAIAGAALDPIAELAGVVRDAVEVVIAAGEWVADPHNAARVAMVAGGVVVVVVAGAVIAKPQVEKAAGPVAAAVATKGKSL